MLSPDRALRLRFKHFFPLVAFLLSTVVGAAMIWPSPAADARHIGSFA
jgi:hypothetical protein